MGDFFGSYVGRFVAMFLFFLVPVTVISYVALYFYMVPIIERDGQAQIAEELVQLGEELDSGGLEGLTQTINRRIRQSINDRTVYLLEGPDGQFLAGNVSNDPELYSIGPGIVTLNVIPNGLATPNEYIARAVHLRGGYTLMIGKQTDARHAFQNIIVLGIAVSIALALVVGLIWQAAFEGQMRRILRMATLASSIRACSTFTSSWRRSRVRAGMFRRMTSPSVLGLAPTLATWMARSIAFTELLSKGRIRICIGSGVEMVAS